MNITAIYPDKSKYKMTIDELKEYLKDEHPVWRRHFFDNLFDNGRAYGPIATYYLN
jgi:hypothetical protein